MPRGRIGRSAYLVRCSMTKVVNKGSRPPSENPRAAIESASFLRRLIALQHELQRRSYPNASTLAALCGCSRSTAMRTIDRLRYEFGVPIEYDESNRGYFLSNPNFSFVPTPLSRDELVALVVLREVTKVIDDARLRNSVEALWVQSVNGRGDLSAELLKIAEHFSVALSSQAVVPRVDIVELLFLCHRNQLVIVAYDCPWRDGGVREYVGIPQRIVLRDGLLFITLRSPEGCPRTLNLSFVRRIQEVTSLPAHLRLDRNRESQEVECPESIRESHLGPDGIIEVHIDPAGGRFFASQRWHEQQQDRWERGVLIRSFPAEISPETARRLIGLGRFLVCVKPQALMILVKNEIHHLLSLNCDAGTEVA